MGYISIDEKDLKLVLDMKKEDCRPEELDDMIEEQRIARLLHPLVSRHHLLLVSLLLMNALANEALPIFLDRLTDPITSVVLSVSVVLIFGEILPSAVFTGPNQMKIAARMTHVVWFIVYGLFVIAWPLSKVLDHVLPEGGLKNIRVPKLKALLRAQHKKMYEGKETLVNDLKEHGLHTDEIKIMLGALEIKHTTAAQVMIPLSEVFMMDVSTPLTEAKLADILASGHSRVPLYEGNKHNVRGMLLIKRLIVLEPSQARRCGDLGMRRPITCTLDRNLLDLLNDFQEGRSHLAIVCNRPKIVRECMKSGKEIPPDVHMAGIVTLEDVIEKLIKEPILDEADYQLGVKGKLKSASDNRKRIRQRVQHLRALAKVRSRSNLREHSESVSPSASKVQKSTDDLRRPSASSNGFDGFGQPDDSKDDNDDHDPVSLYQPLLQQINCSAPSPPSEHLVPIKEDK